MKTPIRVIRLLLIFTVTGCALHHTSTSTQHPNVITYEEIDSSGESNIYDVIVKLHAEYLRDRGPTSAVSGTRDIAVVFVNDQEYGAIGTLSSFQAHDIAEVRYYPGTDAVAKFGRRYGGGVIQLITRVD
jgi:hypothetical protein